VQTWLSDAFKHAEREYPKESCGLVYKASYLHWDQPVDDQLAYFPCRNLSVEKDLFYIHPEDYAECEDRGDVLQVVHSHPNYPPEPSQADLVACEQGNLPWTIIGWPSKKYRQIVPKGYKAPLVGRQFTFGLLDCYTLIRDYYKEVVGITLNDYERENYFWERGEDLYEENFRKEGFEEVEFTDIKKHDLILMAIKSKVINHAAVFLGHRNFNGKTEVPVILHHVQDRLSEEVVYGGFWHKNMRKVIRHKDFIKCP